MSAETIIKYLASFIIVLFSFIGVLILYVYHNDKKYNESRLANLEQEITQLKSKHKK